MPAHPFEDVTPDHQETGAGKAHAGKSIDGDDVIRIVDLQHIVESGRRHSRPVGRQHPLCLIPVDPLDGIDTGDHVRFGFD